jgi:hypothetical protein
MPFEHFHPFHATKPASRPGEGIHLFGERDESGASEKATNECGIRWLSAECDVRMAWLLVGSDLSDELRVQE